MRDFSTDHRGCRSTPRRCASSGRWTGSSTSARPAASAPSARGATRSPRSGSPASPSGSRRRGSACRATAAAACSRPPTRAGRPRRSTTTAARSTKPGRSMRRASCWWSGRYRARWTASRRTRTSPGSRTEVRDGIAASLEYARSVGMPLAIEPLHPMYAAERACINTLEHALDVCDELDPRRSGRARRGASTSITSGGTRSCEEQIAARRARAAAGLPCLRLADADPRPAQRPRHDGRRRHRHPADPRLGRGRRVRRLQRGRDLLDRATGGSGRRDEVLDTCIERHRSCLMPTAPSKRRGTGLPGSLPLPPRGVPRSGYWGGQRSSAAPAHVEGAGDQHALHQRQAQPHVAGRALVHQRAEDQRRAAWPMSRPA